MPKSLNPLLDTVQDAAQWYMLKAKDFANSYVEAASKGNDNANSEARTYRKSVTRRMRSQHANPLLDPVASFSQWNLLKKEDSKSNSRCTESERKASQLHQLHVVGNLKALQGFRGRSKAYLQNPDPTYTITSEGFSKSICLADIYNLLRRIVLDRRLVSGDDHLPKRDDIGERQMNHELHVLTDAGNKSGGDSNTEPSTWDVDGSADMEVENETERDLDYYSEVEAQHKAKVAAKSEYSRISMEPLLLETHGDGKRHVSYQMEKNRGLTRARKRLIKNPRKKYKLEYQKAVICQKGQVREIKKPSRPHTGKASGINAGVSRSIRFKN